MSLIEKTNDINSKSLVTGYDPALTPPPPPSPPVSQTEAENYIWNTLQNFVVDNQQALEQELGKTYAELIAELNQFYQEASEPNQDYSQIAEAACQAFSTGTPSPISQGIDNAYNEAQNALQQVIAELNEDSSAYDSLESEISNWEAEIAQLQGEISKAKDPQKAAQDLAAAQAQLSALQTQAKSMQADIRTLQSAQDLLNQLQTLSQISDPTLGNLQDADLILREIENQLDTPVFSQAQTDFNKNNPSSDQISNMNAAIQTVQNDIGGTPFTVNGQTAYIDLGCLSGVGPGKTIDDIIAALLASGVKTIELSFAQLTDPNSWTGGIDALTFQAMITAAHAAGIKVNLSFGGANGTGDWTFATNADAETAAAGIYALVSKYGLDGLDFDYEDGPCNQDTLLTFFTTLHSDLSGQNVPMTLTVDAGPSNSVGAPDGSGFGGGPIEKLFDNFSSCFDGLNLMMYGGPEYLTSTNPNYMLMWLGKDGAGGIAQQYHIPLSEIHIGFMDYGPNNPNGYPGTGTDGENAANAYLQVLKTLGYTPSQLGSTFWWANEGISTGATGYLGVINALDEEIEAFDETLNPPPFPETYPNYLVVS